MNTKQVKIGLYGCNVYRTGALVEAANRIRPGCLELAAGFDVDAGRAQALAEKYGLHACASLEEFLSRSFEVAMISLPPYLHPEAFARCAAAGKDVYLEKPVCVDEAGRATLLATVARFPQVRCYVGLSLRHVAVFRKVCEIVRRPEAGRLLAVHHVWRSPGISALPVPLNWRHRLEQSGGELNQHCCHVFDWLEWCHGPLRDVVATAFTPPGALLPHEEEELSACFTYGSGALASFSFSQNSHQNVQFGTVHMENLAICYQWGEPTFVKVYRTRPRAADEVYEFSLSDYPGDCSEQERNADQIAEFIDAWQTGRPMPISLRDGIRAYDIMSTIRKSVRSGKRETLPPAAF